MVTIQDFPTELLCTIFRAVQERDRRPRSSGSLSYYRSRLRSLAPLSLVCKSWRQMILEHGVLWTSIPVDTSRPDCLESTSTMLKRSNGAELELSVYLGTDSSVLDFTRSILRTLRCQGGLIKSLYLSASSYDVPERRDQFPEATTNAITIINELILPRPDHLSTQCPTSLFQNLSNLSLSLPSSTAAVKVSMILDVVKSCAGLEYLRLASFHSVSEDCSPASAIQMPHLLRVSLRDCDSATILSYIITPATSFIDIMMDHRRARHAHILTAFPRFPANTHALEETTKLILKEDENHGGFGLGLSTWHSQTSSLVITNRSLSCEKFIPRSLSAIAAHSYFGAIRSFTFLCSSYAPAPWSIVLDGFPLLSELNISIRHATDVVYALMQTRPDDSLLCSLLGRIRFRASQGGEAHNVNPRFLDTFRQFRTESHCSGVKITLHYPGRRGKEL